jgi:protein TonB
MLTATHWYNFYPRNLRRSYFVMLVFCWAVVFFIIGYGKASALRAARRAAATESEATIIMPTDTLRYSEMAPPPPLSGENIAAEAALPDATPASVEAVTSTVPLPVPDELAEATTMETQKKVGGVAAPAATGSGAPVFIMPETTKVYDDNKPAPAIFKYMKASVMPTPLHDVQPDYPSSARTMGFEGTAMIDMWLRKDGTVSVVQVYKSSGYPMLDTAAAKAAAQSSFTPARGADGAPVNVWVRRPFRFSLSGGQR